MGICIDVNICASNSRYDHHTKKSHAIQPFVLSIELDQDGTWRLLKPIHKDWGTVVPVGTGGSWSGSYIGIIYIKDSSGNTVMELRETESQGRIAFYWPKKGDGFLAGTIYQGEGRWRPSQSVTLNAWVGIVGKGSLGAGLSGEVALAGMVNLKDPSKRVMFTQTSGRLGAVVGAAGGWGIVFATGFSSAQSFDGYASSGFDYSVAVGTKLKGILNPKLSGIATALKGIENKREAIEGFVTGTNPKFQKLRGELPNIFKAAKDSVLCDPDVSSMVCIDLPGLPGAEIGVFYKWDRISLWRK